MDGNNNQQPPIQPTQPVQPMQPVQPVQQPIGSNPTPYQMPPKRGMGKGALWGIIGGIIGAIVLVVGIVLAVVMLGGPSPQDYSKAGEVLTDVINASNDIVRQGYELTSTSGTDTTRKNAADAIKESRNTINNKLDELGKMKAITNDKEVKEKYDALIAKREKFNKAIDFSIEMLEKLMPLIKKMSDVSSLSTLSEINALIDEIDATEFSDSGTNEFKNAMVAYIKAAKDYAETRLAGDYDSVIYNNYSSASKKYYDALKDWQSNLEKMTKEARITDDINALKDILNRKMTEK